ncbi:hypothetical protein [Paraburkholderia rhizosphaerae]|uniref:Uncharacterized protein n=1 Tax=Paraburkholderia rhizosphaerae TaxID=480658 RepID=A0A4R8LJC0_9BURK|nr:hypothetical protein [Paraburkholderia rhizosphaerae]TDY43891.1 hypothetical protein BX592_11793 [Paraburkholderia rhizosphaerae]
MFRIYEYKGFAVSIAVEASVLIQRSVPGGSGFLATVQVASKREAVPLTAPLHLAGRTGEAFHTEADALMGGYAAGQRLVEALLRAPR